jgi:hypothetical protein
MPRLLPPPIVVPPRFSPSESLPSLSPISTPPIPTPNKTYFIENNRICTIRNDMQVCLLIFYHIAPNVGLYATIKDVRDKRQDPAMRYSLIWGTNKWNSVQCCSLNELSDILADCL